MCPGYEDGLDGAVSIGLPVLLKYGSEWMKNEAASRKKNETPPTETGACNEGRWFGLVQDFGHSTDPKKPGFSDVSDAERKDTSFASGRRKLPNHFDPRREPGRIFRQHQIPGASDYEEMISRWE